MSEQRICPNCQSAVPSDAPEGVCPACALRAGFDLGDGSDSPTRTSPVRDAPPLPAEELARRLPELERFELIGQGGMGAVYRARHRKLDRDVAVKVLDSSLSYNAAFAERFAREARTMAHLDHSNIVRVYDFDHRDDVYYLVMEYVDGVNLRQTIEADGLEPAQALALVPQICEALQYAHDQGVVHRDIKPENILLDKNGKVKIADFGLAKLVGGGGARRLTRTEQIMGTPNYMAPEQIENTGEVDHRADIYSLGVVFYELLTGGLPVGRFPPPSDTPHVDARLDDVVLRTLEKEPDLRYQQASELRSEVVSLSDPISAGVVTPKAAGVTAGIRDGQGSRTEATSMDADGKTRTDFEYKSERTLFGLPLVHIASSRDPKGKRMRLACGVIAIGDVAVGGVALGGMSFGLITIGGISVGLLGIGGLALGLLSAIGGVAIGGFAVGGLAIGLTSLGALPVRFYLPTARDILTLVAFWTAVISAAICALVYAWVRVNNARERG